MASWGYGEGYEYPHNHPEHFVETDYLPDALRDRVYYTPSDSGAEKGIAARLRKLWRRRRDDANE